ncbi:hypothetical protein [Streptomyces roseochromogenus]|nr:hypothetical protein [Streptomyces roseochromogenus]
MEQRPQPGAEVSLVVFQMIDVAADPVDGGVLDGGQLRVERRGRPRQGRG